VSTACTAYRILVFCVLIEDRSICMSEVVDPPPPPHIFILCQLKVVSHSDHTATSCHSLFSELFLWLPLCGRRKEIPYRSRFLVVTHTEETLGTRRKRNFLLRFKGSEGAIQELLTLMIPDSLYSQVSADMERMVRRLVGRSRYVFQNNSPRY
jgi:hypothetical protein